MRHKSGAPL